jgi:hypothetical protein
MRCDVVRFFLHFGARVFDRDGQPAGTHGGKIDDIVSHECRLVESDAIFFHDLFEGGAFVLDPLANIFEFQIPGAQRHGFGDALGDEPGLDAGQTRERDGSAVVGMKSLGFNQGLTVEPKPSLAAAFGGLFEHALFDPGRSGEDEELAVGQHSIDIKEKEFDLAGTRLSGKFGHRRDSSKMPGTSPGSKVSPCLYGQLDCGPSMLRPPPRPLPAREADILGAISTGRGHASDISDGLKTFLRRMLGEHRPWD